MLIIFVIMQSVGTSLMASVVKLLRSAIEGSVMLSLSFCGWFSGQSLKYLLNLKIESNSIIFQI